MALPTAMHGVRAKGFPAADGECGRPFGNVTIRVAPARELVISASPRSVNIRELCDQVQAAWREQAGREKKTVPVMSPPRART